MVAFREASDAGAGIDHHTGTLMAENCGEDAFRVFAGQRKGVGVADSGSLNLNQHFALSRAF